MSEEEAKGEPQAGAKGFMVRRGSLRGDESGSLSRRGSLREEMGGSFSRRGFRELEDPTEPARTGSFRRHSSPSMDMGEMSAREAAAAQEAAEAANKEEEEEEEGDEAEEIEQRQRQSLMDLLDESGKGYNAGGGAAAAGEEEEEEADDDDAAEEKTCGVCMVKHKGPAIIPCEHTYCRLCSRELAVQKGNCPLCNGYIVELLRIF